MSQYFGDQIACEKDFHGIPKDMIAAGCWVTATWTVKPENVKDSGMGIHQILY
jgi:hypothetical protein